MMTTLKVQRRNMETKAKELRRQGYVTGNLFGKEIEASIPLKIEKRDAEKIQKEFGKDRIEVVPIEQAWQNDFAAYDCFIVGASTWFDGELPTYWDELLPELRTLDLKGKKVAVFGLGDQIRYPENFADGIGLLAEVFEGDGATLVGFTSSEGYTFERSRAMRGDRWCGLVVDLDNQSEQAEKRIREWCEQVKNEFDSKP